MCFWHACGSRDGQALCFWFGIEPAAMPLREAFFFYGCSCFGIDILCHGPCAPDRFLISRSVVLNQAGLWLVTHRFFPSHGAEAASPSRATPRRSRVDDSDGSQSECRRARVACAGTSKDVYKKWKILLVNGLWLVDYKCKNVMREL